MCKKLGFIGILLVLSACNAEQTPMVSVERVGEAPVAADRVNIVPNVGGKWEIPDQPGGSIDTMTVEVSGGFMYVLLRSVSATFGTEYFRLSLVAQVSMDATSGEVAISGASCSNRWTGASPCNSNNLIDKIISYAVVVENGRELLKIDLSDLAPELVLKEFVFERNATE